MVLRQKQNRDIAHIMMCSTSVFIFLILPREVGIYGKNRQQHNLAYKHGLQRFEKVCFEVVNRDDKAHMRRRKHLSGNAEGHSDTGKI